MFVIGSSFLIVNFFDIENSREPSTLPLDHAEERIISKHYIIGESFENIRLSLLKSLSSEGVPKCLASLFI